MRLPSTAHRVTLNTSDLSNQRINEQTTRSLSYFQNYPEEIPARLYELDAEWDIERMLEANASVLSLVGLGLGLTVNRRFLTLPVVVSTFLLQHAVQGWCPPLPVMRRLGFRTQTEIEAERYGLLSIQHNS